MNLSWHMAAMAPCPRSILRTCGASPLPCRGDAAGATGGPGALPRCVASGKPRDELGMMVIDGFFNGD